MISDILSSLMQPLYGLSGYSLLMESLYGITKYVAEKTVDEATKEAAKKIVVQPLLRKLFGPEWDKPTDGLAASKTEFSDRLLDYLERHDRALETTLQCLEQLADRISVPNTLAPNNPVFVAIGLTSHVSEATSQVNNQVQRILDDRTPGLPQSIKSGYALLHLRKGNTSLAEIYARSTLDTNPVEAKAWYVLGLLRLQNPIKEINPHTADQAERFLTTAAESGLPAQCALPRAALRVDHYMRRKRKEPTPSLRELAALFGKRYHEAVSWPYGPLNNRLATSRDFKDIWFKKK